MPDDPRHRESGASPNERDDPSTRIIRRHPSPQFPEPLSDDTHTSIIRREPTVGLTPAGGEEPTTQVARPEPPRSARTSQAPSNVTAVAASAAGIVGGWATAVVATDLITAWWRTDQLFCVGVGFLTAVFAASTIGGVIGLLLRRRAGLYLTVVAALLALLIFAGIFVAGADLAGVVYAIPALPAATIALAIAPATWRWTE